MGWSTKSPNSMGACSHNMATAKVNRLCKYLGTWPWQPKPKVHFGLLRRYS